MGIPKQKSLIFYKAHWLFWTSIDISYIFVFLYLEWVIPNLLDLSNFGQRPEKLSCSLWNNLRIDMRNIRSELGLQVSSKCADTWMTSLNKLVLDFAWAGTVVCQMELEFFLQSSLFQVSSFWQNIEQLIWTVCY